MAKVTIKSLAQDLGLSRNTIAMALSDSPKVSPKTKQRIISYALSVGYQKLPAYSYASKKLDKKEPIRILVLRRIDKTAYWDRILDGIAAAATQNNCIIIISTITQEAMENLQLPVGFSDDIDAIFFLHKFGQEYTNLLLSYHKVPIFLDYLNYISPVSYLGDVIKPEAHRSIMQLTRSLIKQGCKKIGFMCPYYIAAETFEDRFIGFCMEMQHSNLPLLPEYIVLSSPHLDKSLSFQEALDSYPDIPDAIVCANDETAARITALLIERGYRVPEDVAITGFDNDEFESYAPFFTTVDGNAFSLGEKMVYQLLWRMEHPDAPFETITVQSIPIYRKSSQKNLESYDSSI